MTTDELPRALCVDDNRDLADSVVDLLQIVGYNVAFYDGPAALARVESFDPHVLLIDLNMPGMGGDELAVRLRATGRALVLVAVTAMSNEASRARIVAAGFDLHLVKPVDPRLLSDHLRALWPTKGLESG